MQVYLEIIIILIISHRENIQILKIIAISIS